MRRYACILSLILLLVLPVSAKEQQVENRDYLEIFTPDEQCIIYACENQLDGTFFGEWYAVFLRKSEVTLWDISSIFATFRKQTTDISVDSFFEYLKIGLDIEKNPMYLNIYERTKAKVWSDYYFLKEQQQKDEFYQDLSNFIKKYRNYPLIKPIWEFR